MSGHICNALVDKNTVNTEVKWLSIKYITSKGVLMLPIQQTTMYSNLVTNGREVDGVMHMTGQVVYCILDKRGLTNLLRLFSHNCTASLKSWMFISFLVKSFVNVWGLGVVNTEYSGGPFSGLFWGMWSAYMLHIIQNKQCMHLTGSFFA